MGAKAYCFLDWFNALFAKRDKLQHVFDFKLLIDMLADFVYVFKIIIISWITSKKRQLTGLNDTKEAYKQFEVNDMK